MLKGTEYGQRFHMPLQHKIALTNLLKRWCKRCAKTGRAEYIGGWDDEIILHSFKKEYLPATIDLVKHFRHELVGYIKGERRTKEDLEAEKEKVKQ